MRVMYELGQEVGHLYGGKAYVCGDIIRGLFSLHLSDVNATTTT